MCVCVYVTEHVSYTSAFKLKAAELAENGRAEREYRVREKLVRLEKENQHHQDQSVILE